MRFFESWWERVPTQLLPLLLVGITIILRRPMDHFWE